MVTLKRAASKIGVSSMMSLREKGGRRLNLTIVRG
jgi:hypothetical protein